MQLKGIDFGHVFGQSGVQGFFGEGDEYRHHFFYKMIPGFSFKGMTFVAKTVTIEPRIYPHSSNTELRDGYKVKHFFPKSVWCSPSSFIKGYMLNAIGLANPGAEEILRYDKWQKRDKPFQISFIPMNTVLEGKIKETECFCHMLNYFMRPELFLRKQVLIYGIQVNFSCPNTGHEGSQDTGDIIEVLKVFRRILPEVPIIPKFDLLIEPESIVALKPYCDAFMVGNTLPFGKKVCKRWWARLFSDAVSPLHKHFQGKFAGGLSGKPLFPLLVRWLQKMETYDPTVVIIAGGGIMKKKDILLLSQFKIVHGIALGSVAILRPWRLRALILYANEIFTTLKKNSHEKNHSYQPV